MRYIKLNKKKYNIMSKKTFKLVFLGDSSVGKSSLIKQKIQQKFDEFSEPTIGAAFISTQLNLNENIINLQIWDTAGQERYRSLAPMYYRGAHVTIVVFSLTSRDSFNGAKLWIKKLYENNKNTLIFFVGNKLDLVNSDDSKRQISFNEAENYAKTNQLFYSETSAKSGDNINNLFLDIAKELDKIKIDVTKNNVLFPHKFEHKKYRYTSCCN
jgi:small GTP-binding protein